MNRREAIRYILIASAGTVFMTGCSDKKVVEQLVEGKLDLDKKHMEYLGKISNTFLPRQLDEGAVDTPATFIQTMLNECHSTKDIEDFALGFDQYKLLMKESQLKISSAETEKVIKAVEEILEAVEPREELIKFIEITRNRSIEHYLTSETFQTNILEYKLVPERFDGCIDA